MARSTRSGSTSNCSTTSSMVQRRRPSSSRLPTRYSTIEASASGNCAWSESIRCSAKLTCAATRVVGSKSSSSELPEDGYCQSAESSEYESRSGLVEFEVCGVVMQLGQICPWSGRPHCWQMGFSSTSIAGFSAASLLMRAWRSAEESARMWLAATNCGDATRPIVVESCAVWFTSIDMTFGSSLLSMRTTRKSLLHDPCQTQVWSDFVPRLWEVSTRMHAGAHGFCRALMGDGEEPRMTPSRLRRVALARMARMARMARARMAVWETRRRTQDEDATNIPQRRDNAPSWVVRVRHQKGSWVLEAAPKRRPPPTGARPLVGLLVCAVAVHTSGGFAALFADARVVIGAVLALDGFAALFADLGEEE